jgi:hypothetical protein
VLTHYTLRIEDVVAILTNGFAWVATSRELAQLLMPKHDFAKREPQQFGMICFTELSPSEASRQLRIFGRFGVVVSDRWAAQHNAQRVVYVEKEGPVVSALRALFEIGLADLERRIQYPDDTGWTAGYHNKAVASGVVGSRIWANCLTLWEYLQPAEHAGEREWRVVNPMPHYGISKDRREAISLVAPPQGWSKYINVVSIQRPDVDALVCQRGDEKALLAALPAEYRDVRVRTP